jgi:hypothetical protein
MSPVASDTSGVVKFLKLNGRNWGGKTVWLRRDYVVGDAIEKGVMVIDDYYYPREEMQAWRHLGFQVVCFTEFKGDFPADVIVNQNIGAEKMRYNNPMTLLGTRFFMLRQEYLTIDPINSMGGIFDADSVNRKLSPSEFAHTLAEARVIICSAGLTVYEALYLDKPVLLRCAAENQKNTYDNLIQGGYCLPYTKEYLDKVKMGWTPETKGMGKLLIDGEGPNRVVHMIKYQWERIHGSI